MAEIYTPVQEVIFKPLSSKLHTTIYNDSYTQYIDNEFNKITRLMGRDIILNGLDVASSSYTNYNISVTINSGRCIANDTYIEIESQSSLTYENAYIFDPEGYFLLFSDYVNDSRSTKNTFRFKLIYVDRNFMSFDNFKRDKNTILFAAFQISKNASGYINGLTQIADETVLGVYSIWEDNYFYNGGGSSWDTELIESNLFLYNTTYNFEFECYDCDSISEGRMRFECKDPSISSIDIWGSNTGNNSWVTQTGNVNILSTNYYNILAKGQYVDQKNFKLTGVFPYIVRKTGELTTILEGGEI